MSKNILNYKDWGSKVFEQEQPTTDTASDRVKFNTTVGGTTVGFVLIVSVDKETKNRYPGSLQMFGGGKSFLASRQSGGSYNFPGEQSDFLETFGAIKPTAKDDMSVAGAWKKFVADVQEAGLEIKLLGNFNTYMNGEYVSGGKGYQLVTKYFTSRDHVNAVPDGYSSYTFKFRPYDITNVDTKEKTGTNVARQVFVSNDKGANTSYLMKKTLYGKYFDVIDKKGTAFATLTPKNPEEVSKLGKVLQRDHLNADWFWEEVGKALKTELDKLA